MIFTLFFEPVSHRKLWAEFETLDYARVNIYVNIRSMLCLQYKTSETDQFIEPVPLDTIQQKFFDSLSIQYFDISILFVTANVQCTSGDVIYST